MTKVAIRNVVAIIASFALVMLIIVGGSRIVEMLNYTSRLEQFLSIVMVGIVSCEAARIIPGMVLRWLEKDD